MCLICARENLQLRAWLTKRKTSVEICVVYESVLKITRMENKIIKKILLRDLFAVVLESHKTRFSGISMSKKF